MAIRQTIGQLGRIRDQVRETLQPETSDTPQEPTGEATTSDVDRGNLFECSDCGVVYIDSEKGSCSNCEVEVEQVQSTLTCR